MTTQETAKRTNTPYFIEYIHEGDSNSFYFQLVRTKDEAILYANPEIEFVFSRCFQLGITKEQITIW